MLAYERAEAAALAYGMSHQMVITSPHQSHLTRSVDMTMDDLLSLSPKFWDFHRDPVIVVDGAAFTIMTIAYNLCAGTISRYAMSRPDLVPIVEDILRFRKQ